MTLKTLLLLATLLVMVSCSDPCGVAHYDEYYTGFCESKGLNPLSDGIDEGLGFSLVFCRANDGELKQFTLTDYLKECNNEVNKSDV